MRELSGNFQIGAAQKAHNGAVAVALGAFLFRASDNRGKFLFWAWGVEEVKFWTAARKMTLNTDLYAVHRAAVVAKLKADATDYVAGLRHRLSGIPLIGFVGETQLHVVRRHAFARATSSGRVGNAFIILHRAKYRDSPLPMASVPVDLQLQERGCGRYHEMQRGGGALI